MMQKLVDLCPNKKYDVLDEISAFNGFVKQCQVETMVKYVADKVSEHIDDCLIYDRERMVNPVLELMMELDNPDTLQPRHEMVDPYVRIDYHRVAGQILAVVNTTMEDVFRLLAIRYPIHENDGRYFDKVYEAIWNTDRLGDWATPSGFGSGLAYGRMFHASSEFSKDLHAKFCVECRIETIVSMIKTPYERSYRIALKELGETANLSEIEMLANFYAIKLPEIDLDILTGKRKI